MSKTFPSPQARAWFEPVEDSPFVAALSLAPSGEILHANPTCGALLGVAPETLAGRTLGELFLTAADDQAFQRLLREAWTSGQPTPPQEIQLAGADRAARWLLCTLYPLVERGEVVCIGVDTTAKKRMEEALLHVAEGVSAQTGEAFFRSMVEHLARVLDVELAFIGSIAPGARVVEPVAMWRGDRLVPAPSYELANTPCQEVMTGRMCVYPQDVQSAFPFDPMLVELHVESYLGAPLVDSRGQAIGLIVALDTKPLADPGRSRAMLQIFAARAAAELERKRDGEAKAALEEELRRAQKLEAVATLAGGVAHDFNNLMTVILGHTHLLREDAGRPDEVLRSADAIERAAERAAELTRQLLGFARRGERHEELVDVHELVRELVELFSRTWDAKIRVDARLDAPEHSVIADPDQLYRAFFNLAVNARDAMPTGGLLLFETATCDIDAAARWRALGLEPGRCLRLSVADTGIGIAPEVLPHLFEPFFSTKRDSGHGTGLGLAMVYGILKSHRGAIEVEKSCGLGTTFRVYLPLSSG